MTLANVSNQLLKSQGNDTTTVAANYPITGDGSTQLPLGLAEDYSGADGESLTFDIADITDGHRVTISGIQGSSSFDVLNGQDGANGVNGLNGVDGQSVTFDITNINGGHRVTLSGVQGSSSFDIMNGQNGFDGVSPTFRFAENADGITVIVSGAQGEDSFTLYNGEGGHAYSAGPNIDITDYTISGKDWSTEIESAISSVSGNYYPMTGNPSGFLTAIDLSDYYQKNETSSREEINAAIAAIPGAVDYTAGSNIDITNHVISGKDWSTEITAASAYAASQGKTYTGVSPIVVNNTEDKISANCVELSAGNGIDSNKLAIGTIEVSGAGNYDDIFTYQLSTPATGYTIHSGLELRNYQQQGAVYKRFYVNGVPIGDVVPTAYDNNQFLTTNAQGALQWENQLDLMTDYTVMMDTESVSAVDLSSYNAYKQVTLVTPYLYENDGGLTAYSLYINGVKKRDLQSGCYYTFVKQVRYDTTAWTVACSGYTISIV